MLKKFSFLFAILIAMLILFLFNPAAIARNIEIFEVDDIAMSVETEKFYIVVTRDESLMLTPLPHVNGEDIKIPMNEMRHKLVKVGKTKNRTNNNDDWKIDKWRNIIVLDWNEEFFDKKFKLPFPLSCDISFDMEDVLRKIENGRGIRWNFKGDFPNFPPKTDPFPPRPYPFPPDPNPPHPIPILP